MAQLPSLRAIVFCCFASACQEVILDLFFSCSEGNVRHRGLWPAGSNGAASVPQRHGVLLFRKRLPGGHFGLFFLGLRPVAWRFQ